MIVRSQTRMLQVQVTVDSDIPGPSESDSESGRLGETLREITQASLSSSTATVALQWKCTSPSTPRTCITYHDRLNYKYLENKY